MKFRWIDSRITKEEEHAASEERLYQYGDGCFESLRVWQGKPLFMEGHLNRLRNGCEFLSISFDPDQARDAVSQSIQSAGLGSARLRITVFRGGGGRYLPGLSKGELLIEMSSLPDQLYPLTRISAGFSERTFKPFHPLFSHKTCNSLLYILAGLEAKEKGWDDAILLNGMGKIAEATSSNIFLVSEGEVHTPDEGESVIPGIQRRNVIDCCRREGIPVKERPIEREEVEKANEVFLTNAVRGIMVVESLNDMQRFQAKMATRLSSLIRQAATGSV